MRSGQAGPGWEEARVGMWGWGDWLTPPSQALGPEARSWSWAVREKGLECQPQPGTQRARPFLPLLPSLPTSSPPPRPPPRWECLGWTPLARSPRRWCPPPLPGLRGRRRPPHTPPPAASRAVFGGGGAFLPEPCPPPKEPSAPQTVLGRGAEGAERNMETRTGPGALPTGNPTPLPRRDCCYGNRATKGSGTGAGRGEVGVGFSRSLRPLPAA